MAANSKSYHFAGCPRRKSSITGFLASILLPAFAFVAPLSAQQSDVSLKLDVVAWGDEIGGLSFKSSDKNAAITALAFRYSEPVSYSGPALMEIFKNGDGDAKSNPQTSEDELKHQLASLQGKESAADKSSPAAKQGLALELEKRRQKAPDLVALAPLPAGCARATVLLAPVGDGTYLAYVIDDDPSKLPVGDLRIHNLSQLPVAVKINGKTTLEMKSRDSRVVPVANEQIIYDLAFKLDEEWKFQEHNILQVFAKHQTQMIILKSENSQFKSSDGSTSGFLQVVLLRRTFAR